jgi:hypothetical protein
MLKSDVRRKLLSHTINDGRVYFYGFRLYGIFVLKFLSQIPNDVQSPLHSRGLPFYVGRFRQLGHCAGILRTWFRDISYKKLKNMSCRAQEVIRWSLSASSVLGTLLGKHLSGPQTHCTDAGNAHFRR